MRERERRKGKIGSVKSVGEKNTQNIIKNEYSAVREKGVGGWVRSVKELSKEEGGGGGRFMDTDNNMVIAKGKREWEEVEEGRVAGE